MAARRVYLDHNAGAPLRPGARAALEAALGLGNPSSVHAEGRSARALIEAARGDVAALSGDRAAAVIFTSGATEAAATALRPAIFGDDAGRARLLIFAAEHACALKGHDFPAERAILLPALPDGTLDLGALADALGRLGGAPCLLALQGANNETGAIQPLAAAAELVHAAGGLVFCDAAQTAGRLAPADAAPGADLLAVSAHKIGGPPGAGALIARCGAFAPAAALLRGGGQERGMRAGTENTPAIAGFAAAAREALAARASEEPRLRALRDRLEAGIADLAPGRRVFSSRANRLSNTCCLALPGVGAETLLMALDLAGVAASSGSACSSGKVGASHVLAAMGEDESVRGGAVRVSLGWTTTEEDITFFVDALSGALARMRPRRARAA